MDSTEYKQLLLQTYPENSCGIFSLSLASASVPLVTTRVRRKKEIE